MPNSGVTPRPRPSTDSAYRHRHGPRCHSRHYSTPETRPIVPVSYTINANSTIHVVETPEKPIYYLPTSISTHCEHLRLLKAPSATDRAVGVEHEVYVMSHTPTTHRWTFMPAGTHVPPGVCEQSDVTKGGVVKFKHVKWAEWLVGGLATLGGGGAAGGAEAGGAGEGHYEITWTVFDKKTDSERTLRLRCESDNVTWKLLHESQLHPPTPPNEADEDAAEAEAPAPLHPSELPPLSPTHSEPPMSPKYPAEIVIAVEKIEPHIGKEAGETITVHFEKKEVTDEVFEILMCAWLVKCWRERIKHKGWFTSRDHDSKTHGLKYRW